MPTTLIMRRLLPVFAMLSLILSTESQGFSPSSMPRQAYLLPGSERILALKADDCLSLFSTKDRSTLARYPGGSRIIRFVPSPDQKSLLMICHKSLSLWDLETGQKRWQKSAKETGLLSVYDVAFAGNGQSFIIVGLRQGPERPLRFAFVSKTETGENLCTVPTGMADLPVASAALSPEGNKAVLVGGSLLALDVRTGEIKNLGIWGVGPICYSVDGKYIAFVHFPNADRWYDQKLRVVALGDKMTSKDIGPPCHINRIFPAKDGTFLVTAVKKPEEGSVESIGMQFFPTSGEFKEIWRFEGGATRIFQSTHQMGIMDFDLSSNQGVFTTYALVTQLVDLKTGKAILTIDNRHNYKEPSWYEMFGSPWPLGLSFLVVDILYFIGVLVLLVRRFRRTNRKGKAGL